MKKLQSEAGTQFAVPAVSKRLTSRVEKMVANVEAKLIEVRVVPTSAWRWDGADHLAEQAAEARDPP